MSQKIQIRRGTSSTRTSFVPDQGEPVWTVDSREFYIGDGSTAGGVRIGLGLEGDSYKAIMPNSGDTAANNASGFYTALVNAKTKQPFGSGLAKNNRYSVLLFPGKYDFTSLTAGTLPLNLSRYVDVIGVGKRDAIRIINNSAVFAFSFASGYSKIENVTFDGALALGAGTTINYLDFQNVNVFSRTITQAAISPNGVNVNYSSFVNVNTTGAFMDCSPASFGFNFCNVDGGNFIGPLSFSSPSSAVAMKNNVVKNANIISNGVSALFYSDVGTFSFDETNYFDNCYISGTSLFQDDGASLPFRGNLNNCRIRGNVASFEGKMTNCSIDGREFSTTPLTITNSTTYPAFYNCTVLASTAVSVTGTAITTSGLFMHSAFNKILATGVTGRFGNQFNSVNASAR